MLGYLVYQAAKQARDIIRTQREFEELQRRQQMLLRSGMNEEEAESCSVSSDDEGPQKGALSEEKPGDDEPRGDPKKAKDK